MASQQTQDEFEHEQDHVDGELEDDDEAFGPVLVNKLVVRAPPFPAWLFLYRWHRTRASVRSDALTLSWSCLFVLEGARHLGR